MARGLRSRSTTSVSDRRTCVTHGRFSPLTLSSTARSSRTFESDAARRALVASIVDYAEGVGARPSVAEGVETTAELDTVLESLGVSPTRRGSGSAAPASAPGRRSTRRARSLVDGFAFSTPAWDPSFSSGRRRDRRARSTSGSLISPRRHGRRPARRRRWSGRRALDAEQAARHPRRPFRSLASTGTAPALDDRRQRVRRRCGPPADVQPLSVAQVDQSRRQSAATTRSSFFDGEMPLAQQAHDPGADL